MPNEIIGRTIQGENLTFDNAVFNANGIIANAITTEVAQGTDMRYITDNLAELEATVTDRVYRQIYEAMINTPVTAMNDRAFTFEPVYTTTAQRTDDVHRGYRANQVYIDDMVAREFDWSVINQYITPFEAPVPPDTELSDKDNKSLDSFLEGFSKKEAV